METNQTVPHGPYRNDGDSNLSPLAAILPLSAAAKGLMSFLPGTSVLGPLAASFADPKGGLAASWFTLMLFTWLNGVLLAIWSFFNPLDNILSHAYIDSIHYGEDDSYDWLLTFWRKHPSYRSSRSFITETSSGVYNDPEKSLWAPLLIEQTPTNEANPSKPGDKASDLGHHADTLMVAFKPKETETFWFWRHGSLFRLSRTCKDDLQTAASSYGSGAQTIKREIITVRSISTTRRPLLRLLREARDLHEKAQPSMLDIYVYEPVLDFWQIASIKQKRSLSSVKMDQTDKSRLLNDAKEFLSSRDWYAARGIPWRRGYMFHGSPGTGKSSTIQALASELDMPVYTLPLASRELTDHMLAKAMRRIRQKSILILEDIDVALTHKRDIEGETGKSPASSIPNSCSPPSNLRSQGLSLSALLNCIDGVGSGEGRIHIMTSNDMSSLDTALIRPGRCDLFFEYREATREQASQLFIDFYADLGKIAGTANDKELQRFKDIPAEKAIQDLMWDGTELETLARRWSEHIDDYEFSMASLQGMLLEHKKDPARALQGMQEWVVAARKPKTPAKATSSLEGSTVVADTPVKPLKKE